MALGQPLGAGREDARMAQRVTTVLLDDLNLEQEAVQTVAFAVDGTAYEIDLSEEHARDLRDVLAPYVDAGRRTIGGTRAAQPTRRRSATLDSSSAAPDPGVVRAWARERNVTVNDRARIKGTVVAQFLQATR